MKKNIICIFISLFIALLYPSNANSASISFQYKSLSIPAGKSFFMPVQHQGNQITWHSSNTSIATVNNGIITAIKPGSLTITASDNLGNNAKCNVNVLKPEPIKFAYYTPNFCLKNSEVELIAITNTNIQDVKFFLDNRYFPASNKTFEGNTIVWSCKITLNKCGTFFVQPFAKINESWEKANSTFNILVSNNTDYNKHSIEKRRISDNAIKFIYTSEGFVPHVYVDKLCNLLTLGYGKAIYPGNLFYNNITKREAYAMLVNTLNESYFCSKLNDFLISNNIMFNQQEFDALLSFSYNIGTNWMCSDSYLKNIILNSTASTSNGKTLKGVVIEPDGLNLRASPSINSKKICILQYNESVTVLNSKKFNNSWYHVKTTNGYEGYCHCNFLSVSEVLNGVKSLQNIDKNNFASEFLSYHHSLKKCILGLFYRRLDELAMFFYGNYNHHYIKGYNPHKFPIPNCIKKLWQL